MDSIFRTKRTSDYTSKFIQLKDFDKSSVNAVSHDNGILRARKYSLSCKLHFSRYSGFSIKELIETDFNYFTWLPRVITNLQYDEDVFKYARKCLRELEQIDNYSISITQTKLGKAVNQVNAMISYEQALDANKSEYMLVARKSLIDIEYYKTIINTPLERLIRQSFKTESSAIKVRRKYFEDICNAKINNAVKK